MFDTPEEKAALAKAIAEAVAEETKELKAKNGELIGEVRKARKATEITPEQLADVEHERDSLTEENRTLKKTVKDSVTALEAAQKANKTETDFTHKLLVSNGLVQELTRNGVTNATSLKAAQALLKEGVTVVADEQGNRVAMVGDKTLAAHVDDWVGTDEGKHFKAALVNGGGGAPGGNGPASAEIMKLSPIERMKVGRKSAQQ